MNEGFQINRKASTLRLLVEDKLRAAIGSGRFEPGQRLVERELCELMGVGRTSVREALRQLEAEGLVTNVPYRGPTVSGLTFEEACQLYEVRALLEGYAARCCAEDGAPEILARLTQALEHTERAVAALDREALIESKTAFYAALVEGSGNVFIKDMLNILHKRITLLRMNSVMHPGHASESEADLNEIRDAIESGDNGRAEVALRIASIMQPGRIGKSLAEIREIRDAIQARDGTRAESAAVHHIQAGAKIVLSLLTGSKDKAV